MNMYFTLFLMFCLLFSFAFSSSFFLFHGGCGCSIYVREKWCGAMTYSYFCLNSIIYFISVSWYFRFVFLSQSLYLCHYFCFTRTHCLCMLNASGCVCDWYLWWAQLKKQGAREKRSIDGENIHICLCVCVCVCEFLSVWFFDWWKISMKILFKYYNNNNNDDLKLLGMNKFQFNIEMKFPDWISCFISIDDFQRFNLWHWIQFRTVHLLLTHFDRSIFAFEANALIALCIWHVHISTHNMLWSK